MSIIKHRKTSIIISIVLVVASVISMATFGLNFGIDFTGGSLMEVRFEEAGADQAALTSFFDGQGFAHATIQTAGNNDFLFRLPELGELEHQEVLAGLEQSFGTVDELRFDSIGPVIGSELRTKALTSIVILLLLIALYITWAFRKVSEPVPSWKYSILTITAALHDIIIPLGVFAALGAIFGWEIGIAFVAAMLTILGYSINDTIVVFDRTRENLLKKTGEAFDKIVDKSIQQTFMRSVNTSVTTFLALLAIFLWGGGTTRPFAFALMVGIVVGTYSSLFLASPLLVAWEKWKN